MQNISDQTSNSGLFKFSSIYKKDYNNQINYDVFGNFSNEFTNSDVNSLVLSDIGEKEKATPYSITQNLSYFYTASEKSIFALEIKHLLKDEDPFYVASLENDPFNNDAAVNDGFDEAAVTLGLNQDNRFYTLEQERRVKSNQLDAKLDYYYILNSKSNLNFVAGTILSSQNFNSRFFQILDNGSEFAPTPDVPGINDAQTTNDTEYNFTDLYAGLRYRLKSGIFTFTPGFTVHAYNSKNTQYGRESFQDKFSKILPEFEVITQFKRSESLTFQYKKEVDFTDVNQIARGIVANSYNSFFAGNADLINASFHKLTLNYRSYNLYNGSNMFARISYNKTSNQVNRNTIFEPGSVVSSSTSMNSPFNNENFNAFGRYGKTFKKMKASFGGNYTYNKTYQFINSRENTNERFSQGVNAGIGTNFTKAPNVSIRYALNFNDQNNSSRDSTIKTKTHAPSINFDAYIWNSFTVRSDFTFNEVRQDGALQNSFKIWNAKLAYRKGKDAKWEYEIEGSNLLATGSRTTVSQNNISFNINETFILPRFISFRVRYQL